MEQQDQKFINFERMVQRVVNAEAKTGPRSSIIVQDLDIHCPKDHCPSLSTASKVQTQGTTAKDSHQEKPKVKEVKPILS